MSLAEIHGDKKTAWLQDKFKNMSLATSTRIREFLQLHSEFETLHDLGSHPDGKRLLDMAHGELKHNGFFLFFVCFVERMREIYVDMPSGIIVFLFCLNIKRKKKSLDYLVIIFPLFC